MLQAVPKGLVRLAGGARRLLLRCEDLLLVGTLCAMILLAMLQIVLRNLWHTSLVWGDPSLRIAVLWVTLLGAMAATRERNHIHIDLVSRLLPQRPRRYTRLLVDGFSSLTCGVLAWVSGRFVLYEWQDGAVLFGSLPAWAGEIILPIGFAVMALRFLANGVADLGAETEE